MKTETPRSKKLRLGLDVPCWLNLRGTRFLFALILLPSLAGCFTTDTRPYPEDWPRVTTVPAGQCPHIAGQYVSIGYAVKAPPLTCSPALKGSWNCDATLSGNLVKMKAIDWHELQQVRAVEWVKLEQPDDDTLEVHFPPAHQLEPKIFKRSQGDFDCDSSGLRFSISASLYSDERMSTADTVLLTTAGLLSLTEGVASTERVFRPLANGSLSMEVTDSKAAVFLAIFASAKKFNAFVRWERYPPSPSSWRPGPSGYVSPGDVTQFHTPDRAVGYNLWCETGSYYQNWADCYKSIHAHADSLCGAKNYNVLSDTTSTVNLSGGTAYRINLVFQCKE